MRQRSTEAGEVFVRTKRGICDEAALALHACVCLVFLSEPCLLPFATLRRRRQQRLPAKTRFILALL